MEKWLIQKLTPTPRNEHEEQYTQERLTTYELPSSAADYDTP